MGALDANGVYRYDGTESGPLRNLLELLAASLSTKLGGLGMFTAYTPVVTASSVNPNLGTAPTRVGGYSVIGKTVTWWAQVTAGGTGIAAGNGGYSVSLPVPPAGSQRSCGYGWLYGASGGFKVCTVDGPGRLIRADAPASGLYIDHTLGFSAAGHVLSVAGSYERT